MCQQEAELPTQNGAAAQAPYRQIGPKQAFLRTVYREGCALQAKGEHQAAARSFSAAIDAAPDFADALQNLGFSLFALGKFEEAAKAFAKLVRLRPGDAGSFFNLGMALQSKEDPADAIEALQSAARLDATQAKHHQALGRALVLADRKKEGLAALMKASELNPGDTDLLVSVSGLLVDQGELNAAAGASLMAIQRQPGNAIAQGNLARALHGLGKTQAALAPARACARLAPMNGGAAATLGAILYTLGYHAEALTLCQKAARLSPGLYQAKMNEALALEALGRLEEAEVAARAALVLAPEAADVKHNFAAMLLASGRMNEEAWDLYESRLLLKPWGRRVAGIQRWQGEDIAGKTLLVHAEQGFGDTIQFVRYAQLATARGARVILVVQPELLPLLQDVPGLHAVIPATVPLPDYDVFCPLLSLPRAFGTSLATIPPGHAYIQPDATLVERWRTPPTAELNIGLVWAGSASFVHDGARSIALAALAPLASVPGVIFHSLQKPVQDTGAFQMQDRMAEATDFSHTAAMIAGLDVVISIDSAVAHLAAAMGKEVWLLSRFVGCWRWLRDREDSPWYPTMRIFRQASPNDWDEVIGRVRDALIERTTGIQAPPKAAQPPTRAAAPNIAPTPPRPSALDGLRLPEGAPRSVAVLVGENENGILRSITGDFMSLLPAHGLDSHCISLCDPGWRAQLDDLIAEGLLFVWGAAGVGARLPHADGLLWDAIQVPFISALADSPCWMPKNHHVPSRWVANGYLYRDWLSMQRQLIRSPQISSLLPHGVADNPLRDRTPWSQRSHRMLLVKTGGSPEQHRTDWGLLPPRFRAVVEDAAAAALSRGVGDISDTVLAAMEHHDLSVEHRPDILFALMRSVDVYVRDTRSTQLVQALLDLPVDIIGRGWDHLSALDGRARFHAAVNADMLPGLYANTQFLLNTIPNFSFGTHERVPNGFAAKCCVISNENADMRSRFGALPSYFGIETAAPELADQLAALFHDAGTYEDRLDPALDLVAARYTAEGFMRGLIDLAMEVRTAAAFEAFGY